MQQDEIVELALFLNLFMVQVGEHKEALYELDTRLLILNMSTMQAVCYLSYTTAVLTNVCTDVFHLTSGTSLKENVDTLHEYLSVLARLESPDDPYKNFWPSGK